MPSCVVHGCVCTWKKKEPGIILHTFPKNEDIIRKWLIQTGQYTNNLEEMVGKVLRGKKTDSYRMCSLHFEEGCYKHEGHRKILKKNAFPTLFPHTHSSMLVHDIQDCDINISTEVVSTFTDKETSLTTHPDLSDCSILASDTEKESIGESSKSVECDIPSKKRKYSQISKSMINENTVSFDHCYASHGFDFSAIMSSFVSRKPKMVDKGVNTDFFLSKKSVAVATPPLLGKRHAHTQTMLPVKHRKSQPSAMVQAVDTVDDNTDLSSQINDEFQIEIPSSRQSSSTETSQDPNDPTFYISDCSDDEDESSDSESDDTDHDSELLSLENNNCNNVDEDKFLVFESCLKQLLKMIPCPSKNQCQSPLIMYKKKTIGSYLSVEVFCQSGHKKSLWESQPRHGLKPLGNVLLSAAILFSGSSFLKTQQMFQLLKMKAIGKTTFYKNQKSYLFPSINNYWIEEQKSVLEAIHHKPLCLAGDGQMDSPGFSAKYCVYTLMDVVTKKIISFSIDQVTEGVSSVGLEKIGFQKTLSEIMSKNITVKMVVTDRHISIRKCIKDNFPGVIHQFDVWHLSKSIGNKVLMASKHRNCEILAQWVPAIKNHVWYCSRTCSEDGEILLKKWKSLLYHVNNVHYWNFEGEYGECDHRPLNEELYDNTKWISNPSDALDRLTAIVKNPRLLKDLKQISFFCHTGELEVFHSTCLKYRPKRLHFQIDAMIARTQLAVLDHNYNVQRVKAVVKNAAYSTEPIGTQRYRMEFVKARKSWVIKNLYEPTTQLFLFDIMRDVISLLKEEKQYQWSSVRSEYPKNIATVPRPDKADMISKHQTRF